MTEGTDLQQQYLVLAKSNENAESSILGPTFRERKSTKRGSHERQIGPNHYQEYTNEDFD